jgi:hypothetical protein
MLSVCMCARFQDNPKQCHLMAVKRILRYLVHTPNLGLWYPKGSTFVLLGYSDSDYAGCKVKDRYGEPERGGSEWEPIKNLLEGDEDSNKMNMASNTRLRLTTQIGQVHVANGVLLNLGTNTQPSDPRTQRNTKPRVH